MIAGKPKLLVVPTGALTSLPFHVLITRKPDPAVAPDDRYRRAAWLLNDKAITVLPSVASLRALRSFAKASHATKPFIGFGDPQLRRSGGVDKRGAARNVQPYQSYYNGTQVDIDQLRIGLPALPDTADELREVAHDLGASDDGRKARRRRHGHDGKEHAARAVSGDRLCNPRPRCRGGQRLE